MPLQEGDELSVYEKVLAGLWDDADNSPLIRPSPPALRACACVSLQTRGLRVQNWGKCACVDGAERVATLGFNSITSLSLTKFQNAVSSGI